VCSKKFFKIKILKDDLVDDDPEVQFTGRGVTKVKEYEGEPFKMRKFYKSNVNKCKRASETITVVPRTTVYSDGRKVTIKVPLRVPSIKSAITAVPLLSFATKTLSTGITESLQEAQVFNDTVTNKTVVSFASEEFRCPEDSYSSTQSFKEIQSILDFLCLQQFFSRS
jgi:hypothetical protein